jgi:NitT/TauT family transport system substrate-binding protein/putative hydroxymethylpyrimidine transport system substrate-binding protein
MRLHRVSPVRARSLLLALACGLAACGGDEPGRDEVALALDFTPNAVHAGLYAAAEDEDAHDLDLTLRPPGASTDSLKLLQSGRAQFAVVDIHDLGLAHEAGADVVGLGGIVQRPLAAVIARPEVTRPRALEGRRVGVTGLPSDDALLRAVVEHDGGDYDRVERVTIGFSAVPSFAAGRVDAVVSFWNAEGVALKRRGVPTREFRVDRFGAPRYPELVLATTSETDPALRRRVVAALREGTVRALSDREAAIERIARASRADRELVAAQFRAVAPALRPPLALDRAAISEWAAFDARFGILERRPPVGELFRDPGS